MLALHYSSCQVGVRLHCVVVLLSQSLAHAKQFLCHVSALSFDNTFSVEKVCATASVSLKYESGMKKSDAEWVGIEALEETR